MKSDLVHSRVQMDRNILDKLVTEVRETVATDVEFAGAERPSFSALKLWSIRRNSRFAYNGRRKPRIVTGFGY